MGTGARYALLSPSPVRGAIALVQVWGEPEEVDHALAGLTACPVERGRIGLRGIAGVDDGIIARVDGSRALIFPHAGAAVVRAVLDALGRAGAHEASPLEAEWPDSADEVEYRILHALSIAQSPLAIDLLLDQPRRWHAEPARAAESDESVARTRLLARLIIPPLVVAVGPPNIGKSSLLNALAKRSVSLVADEPGTTRDHVGASVDLAGLVVNYVDAPGIGAPLTDADADAQSAAMRLARAADLVLSCGDSQAGFLDASAVGAPDVLRIALRSDLGLPSVRSDAVVSVKRGEGIAELVAVVRERLVPSWAIDDPRPWKFWDWTGPGPESGHTSVRGG